jgi:hypothetical protein
MLVVSTTEDEGVGGVRVWLGFHWSGAVLT